MGCIFSCGSDEVEDKEDVQVVNTEPRRPHIQRSRRRSRSPAGNRRTSSRSLSRNVETVAAVHSNNENINANSHNLNSHLGNKNIASGLTGIILFPEALPEEKTIDLPFKTEKAQFVIHLFSKFSRNGQMSLKVRQIKEVNNPYLWTMYNLKKEEMISRDGHVDELLLFHGTKRQNVRSICDDNLNWRLSGSATGNRFGQGTSLSPKATYASHYCDRDMPIKVMFLMRVLFSKAVIGTPDMVIPKVNQNGQTVYYDTSIKEDCSVVVKYCDNEFYPAYVIYFELLKKNQ